MNDKKRGLSSLCVHTLNEHVCEKTGHTFGDSRADLASHERHLHDGISPLWAPTTDDIEMPNQDMLRRKEWHLIVLAYLRAHLKGASKCAVDDDNEEVFDGNTEARRYLFYSCVEFLFHFCWDNTANKASLSEQSTLDFLFEALRKADVRVVVPGDVWDSAWHAGWHAGSGKCSPTSSGCASRARW